MRTLCGTIFATFAMTTVYADCGWMWQFGEAAVSLGECAL